MHTIIPNLPPTLNISMSAVFTEDPAERLSIHPWELR
jgi:hypothetical protein